MILKPVPRFLNIYFFSTFINVLSYFNKIKNCGYCFFITLVFIASGTAQGGPLPQPLKSFDVAQYKRLIDLQNHGDMKQAIREMGRLKDPLLTGHILAQRYLHPTAWRSSFKELSNWLVSYNDHPDASRIYWLAKRRKPANARRPKAPKPGYLNGYGQAGA